MENSPDARFYDSNQVMFSIADRPVSSGRAEGEFYSSDFNADATTETNGADGEVCVSATNRRDATITLKLMQTSSAHTLLMQLYAAQLASTNGAFFAVELNDLTGSKIEHAEKCWIKKAPPSAYGATAGEREWKLACANLVREVVT